MNGNHKIGLFKVCKHETFEGRNRFDIEPKIFLTYDKAYAYVHEAFKRNNRCMPFDERYIFEYDFEGDGPIGNINSVNIRMVLPFYLHIGREWF